MALMPPPRLHDGSCAFFQAAQATTAFVFKPDLANLNIAYAVAITQTPAEQLVIVVGANQGESGVLYRVNAVKSAAEIANYPLWTAQFCLESVGAVCGKSWGDVRCCGHSCHGHRRQT